LHKSSTITAAEITQNLIRFPSITPEDCGAQDYLKSILRGAGFDIFDLPFDGNGSYPVHNFFARIGKGGPHLCFAGHTDVVPAGDEAAWSIPPFSGEIVEGKIIGRGASDMKGCIAAFIAATLSHLADKKDSLKGSISFLITGDEEKEAVNGTVRVLEWMKEHGHIPDVCLVGEPSNADIMGQEMRIGRRGSLTGKLTVHGKQGHAAYPERADNPVPRMIALLQALEHAVFDAGSAHFPPTNLEITTVDVGNTADNVIPTKISASFNLRFSDQWTAQSLEEKIRAILDGVTPQYELRFLRGAHSFLTKPGAWTSLVAQAVNTVTGKTPKLGTGGGTSDARFVAAYCPVVEFGLINQTIHQVDEHCILADLEICEAIYRQILKIYFD
jgi:succinyl-diaminopimelate desuccinylase